MSHALLNHKLTQDFAREWRSLEAAQADLDFRINDWCTRLRTACETDRAFLAVCVDSIKMSLPQAKACLRRVSLAKLVPDSKTWHDLGGFTKIDAVSQLDKRKAVDVIATAKFESLSLNTVMKRKGYIASPTPVAPSPSIALTNPGSSRMAKDLAVLARYIKANCVGTGKHLPKEVLAIVDIYAPGK
jgi:hypothetical protein